MPLTLAMVFVPVLEVTMLHGVLTNATLYFIQLPSFFLFTTNFCSRSDFFLLFPA